VEKVDDPAYASALGTLMWGLREGAVRSPMGNFQFKRFATQAGSWIKSLLP
jgi:hypothetical protein